MKVGGVEGWSRWDWCREIEITVLEQYKNKLKKVIAEISCSI